MAKMVRLDKVKGYPVTFKNELGTLENGLFLELKGLANDYEAYNVALAGATPANTVVLHASVELMYDERKLMQDFALENGAIGRGFILEKGDIVTIAESVISDSVSVGDKVGHVANGLLAKSATAKVAEVIAKEYFGEQMSVVLHWL
jgi:hypothetical protein